MTQHAFAAPPEPWRGMTREKYDALIGTGMLDDAQVELIEGVLVAVVPQGDAHAWAVDELNFWLTRRIDAGRRVRVQLPLAATDLSEPEPDLAVAPPAREGHPRTADLVVEVSVTSQSTDLQVKARVYAAAGVGEYWVLDVPAREVVVHTDPAPTGYRLVRRQPWETPLIAPVGEGITVDLASLLDR